MLNICIHVEINSLVIILRVMSWQASDDSNCFRKKGCKSVVKFKTKQVLASFELATFCVLSRRDNHYTIEPLMYNLIEFVCNQK